MLLLSCSGEKMKSEGVVNEQSDDSTTQTTSELRTRKSILKEDSPTASTAPLAAKESDTLIIEKPAAVFISPNSSRIEKMKEEYGEEDFYTAADDNLYYQSEAESFLREKEIVVIYSTARYLKFMTANGKPQFVATAHPDSSAWTIYLFHPRKAPKSISSIDIEAEYESYFK